MKGLKFLPWITLFQAAILTVCVAVGVDLLLIQGSSLGVVRETLALLFAPPLDTITLIAVSAGIGAIAVYLLETVFRQVIINASTLWALVFCLVVVLVVKSWLPIPGLLVGAEQGSLMGLVLGVFLKGLSHWRRY